MKDCVRFFALALISALIFSLSLFAQDAQKPASDNQPAQSGDDQSQFPDKEQKVKHNGDKDDVDAIGKRKVGGFDWYSWDREIRLGNEYARQIEPNMKMITDPVVTEYINRIGQNLVRNSDVPIPVTIKVIDSDEPNAFTIPGGHLYVFSGLILAADEEAEIAGVMAHELGHIAARHGTRGATRAELANLLRIPAGILIPGTLPGILVGQTMGVGLPLAFLKFSRSFEAEADYLGIQYAYKAGYDPTGLLTFFEKLETMEKQKPGTISQAFATHPQTPDRLQKSQKEIAAILPARDQYIVTTSEFDQVKARMLAIENRHPMNDHKDGNMPTLRRTPSASSPDAKGDGKDDDRPTLRRRN
jgi:beta-barrel assembly-enhancing protease